MFFDVAYEKYPINVLEKWNLRKVVRLSKSNFFNLLTISAVCLLLIDL